MMQTWQEGQWHYWVCLRCGESEKVPTSPNPTAHELQQALFAVMRGHLRCCMAEEKTIRAEQEESVGN